ncbi:MAG: hypothetical protein HXY40_08105 [Chloroflexi bacterium]|nr:hypothetical protein [Chloroflexota bacterium]
MSDIKLERRVDSDVLHATLKAALDDQFLGISTAADDVLIVHLAEDAGPAARTIAQTLVAAHDVNSLPPRPPAKTLEQRLAEIEARLTALENAPRS